MIKNLVFDFGGALAVGMQAVLFTNAKEYEKSLISLQRLGGPLHL